MDFFRAGQLEVILFEDCNVRGHFVLAGTRAMKPKFIECSRKMLQRARTQYGSTLNRNLVGPWYSEGPDPVMDGWRNVQNVPSPLPVHHSDGFIIYEMICLFKTVRMKSLYQRARTSAGQEYYNDYLNFIRSLSRQLPTARRLVPLPLQQFQALQFEDCTTIEDNTSRV